MKLGFVCLTTIALCLGVIPAAAQVDLYDDGPTNGTTDAWTFNFGFTPSDSFTFSSTGHITGLEFAAWLTPGDVLQSVEVTFTSFELGGTVYFDQNVNTIQSGCVVNQYAYNVCTETAMFNGPTFNAGTYWMTLQNGVVANGDPVYWDENSGPSSASVTYLGSIPSESFTILGTSGTSTTSQTTPEPNSALLLTTGIIAAAGLFTRRFH